MDVPTTSELYQLRQADGQEWIQDGKFRRRIRWCDDGRVDEYATFGRLMD